MNGYISAVREIGTFYREGDHAFARQKKSGAWAKVLALEDKIDKHWLQPRPELLAQYVTLFRFISQERDKSMPLIDFDEQGDAPTVVPGGQYKVTIVNVKAVKTKKDDDMFRLKLVIQAGDHAGTTLWDNLVFVPKAMARIRNCLEAVGATASGVVDVTPEMFTGKTCLVEVVETMDNMDRPSNEVTWDGYSALPASEAKDTPF